MIDYKEKLIDAIELLDAVLPFVPQIIADKYKYDLELEKIKKSLEYKISESPGWT